jgi:rsbT antagonist protein RsbS
VKVPILRLGRVLLTSIQIDMSDVEAMHFQQDLLRKITECEALGVAIDISFMEVVDSFMARALNDTASMARLLGAEVVLCGIQPYVAMTLVEMGRELLGIDSAFSLEQGLSILKSRIAQRGDAALEGNDEDLARDVF